MIGYVRLMLCDETRSDFPTPNDRGSWTKRLEVRDLSVAGDRVEMEAMQKLAGAMTKRGVDDLVQWATEQPPNAPIEEASALISFCKTLVVGHDPTCSL